MKHGHPEIPIKRRCMVLNKYDLFPYMLVHKAARMPDGTIRWVSDWKAGHLNLGCWYPEESTGLLAVLSVKEGMALEKELKKLTEDYTNAEMVLLDGFKLRRSLVLGKYKIEYINEPKP